MKTLTRLACAGVLACMLGAIAGCDIAVEPHEHGYYTATPYYYDYYPYEHRYLFHHPDWDHRDRGHVTLRGQVNIR